MEITPETAEVLQGNVIRLHCDYGRLKEVGLDGLYASIFAGPLLLD
jgi:hypothetical protein